MSELSQAQKINSLILLIINIGSQVLFYQGIDSLSLSISLGMKFSRELGINLKVVTKLFPEGRGKRSTTIQDYIFGKTMEFPNIAHKEFGNISNRVFISCGNVVSYLYIMINYNQNCVVSIRLWETSNEVHSNRRPRVIRDLKGLHEAI